MLYRKLGSSGIEVSTVGLGAWAIGGWMWGGTEEGKSIAAIHAALDRGINLIDTAPAYGLGRSEEIVGRAIHGRRDRVVLATKCGLVWDRQEGQFFFHCDDKGATLGPSKYKIFRNLRPESIRAELERSLKRLSTDYIDLYQTHWQDPTTPIAETVDALLKLKGEGKIRAIGVSNANREQLQAYGFAFINALKRSGVPNANREQLQAYGRIDSDQEKYSLLDRQIEDNGVLDDCRRNGIAMLAYSPLANGLLTGKIRPERSFAEGDLRNGNPRFTRENIERVNAVLAGLEPMARRHAVNVSQLAIAWTCGQPGLTSALCGARHADQAIENARAGEIVLSAEELQQIGDAVRGLS
ncbi:MAG: aldo/keto reductase [Thermoguttaceae bacterium]